MKKASSLTGLFNGTSWDKSDGQAPTGPE
jgi:hypothetical protein